MGSNPKCINHKTILLEEHRLSEAKTTNPLAWNSFMDYTWEIKELHGYLFEIILHKGTYVSSENCSLKNREQFIQQMEQIRLGTVNV